MAMGRSTRRITLNINVKGKNLEKNVPLLQNSIDRTDCFIKIKKKINFTLINYTLKKCK